MILGIVIANAKSGETAKREVKQEEKHESYLFTIDYKRNIALQYQSPFTQVSGDIKKIINQNNYSDSNLIKDILIKLDELVKWSISIDSILVLKKDEISEVDIIGQTHISAFQDEQQEVIVLQSQSIIKDLLTKNNYPVVGMESFSGKVWNKNISFFDNFITTNKSYGKNIDDLGIALSTISSISIKSVIDCRNKNAFQSLLESNSFPNQTNIIGIEDSIIHFFNGITLMLGGFNPESPYYAINKKIILLRSYIAYYKLIDFLLNNQKKNGALVIGSAHIKDMTILARWTGVKTNFYNTSSVYQNDWSILRN